MRIQISTKIKNDRTKDLIEKDTNPIVVTDKTTVAEVKTELKKIIKRPLDIVSEKFYYGDKELKDTDLVYSETGYELVIFVK